MPEGPELHMAARLVNSACAHKIFTGKVKKSEVSLKNPDIDWNVKEYNISAVSRGKELQLTLSSETSTTNTRNEILKKRALSDSKNDVKNDCKSLCILFRFGMSGMFTFQSVDDMHKHSHLNFYTNDGMVLSFVDTRRFGRWEVTDKWGKKRGPCVLQEYQLFRENVLNNLKSPIFNRPICEVLLEQKYFNGIGNYLRAEILYRAGPIQPFSKARYVLESLISIETNENGQITAKKIKSEKPDILELCNIIPNEVINLKSSAGYDVGNGAKVFYEEFTDWLQCYYKPEMNNMVDHNGRTMWFSGPAGPMAPKNSKSKKRVSRYDQKNLQNNQDQGVEDEANDDKIIKNLPVKKSQKKLKRKNSSKSSSAEQSQEEEINSKKTRRSLLNNIKAEKPAEKEEKKKIKVNATKVMPLNSTNLTNKQLSKVDVLIPSPVKTRRRLRDLARKQ